MTKLEQLIKELCPNGVESVSIGSLISKVTEKRKNNTSINQVFVVSNTLGLVKAEEYRENTVHSEDTSNYTIVKPNSFAYNPSRLNIGSIALNNTSITGLVSPMYVVFSVNDDIILPQYMELLIKTQFIISKINAFKEEGARFRFDFSRWNWIIIPLPPIEIQKEIINVLSKFKEYNNMLTAELTARKKQYEYYRDSLLSFNESECEWRTLKEISLSHCSGGTPLKSNHDYYDNGTIPWLRTQDVTFNEITQVDTNITELAVKETSAKWIPENCIIVAISGASAGRCAINKIPLTTNQHCLNIQINPQLALYKYVFYCVVNQYDELLQKKEGARGDLNSSRIMSLKIPVPPIKEQERIVSILDRFDKLCNDISEGLPAEIEARRKQYEYYRDKLLSFEEARA